MSHTRAYSIFTKGLSNFGNIHREDKVQYKGSWGRLYLLEDGVWNWVIRKIAGKIDVIVESVDYITEKIAEIVEHIPQVFGINADATKQTTTRYLLIFIAQDEEAPMQLQTPMPLYIGEFLFDYIDQHGRLPPKEAWPSTFGS